MSEHGSGQTPVRPTIHLLPASPPAEPFARVAERAGVDDVVCLGLNEGQFGPFPAALEALEGLLPMLNRYPTRGSTELTEALAERLHRPVEEVIVTAGADAAIGYACQAMLDPGDAIVTPWPSFPSFVRDAQKRDAVPICVPLREGRVEVEALLAAVTERTRLLFLATPNNQTGTAVTETELRSLLERLPGHVLPVVDEAYFEFQDPGARVDSMEVGRALGRPLLVLRTFSKLYGLAGLRVGYAVGPATVVDAMRRVQRGYDVGAPGQVAALASLGDTVEEERRRLATGAGLARLTELLSRRGLEPLPGAAGNFLFVEVGERAQELADALLAGGIVVQPAAPFGAPHALRITVGTPGQVGRLAARLDALPGTHA